MVASLLTEPAGEPRVRLHAVFITALNVCIVLFAGGCDTIEPDDRHHLVVAFYAHAGEPLPSLSVHRTGRLDAPYRPHGEHAVTSADVQLTFGERSVPYAPASRPGTYRPADPSAVIPVGGRFRLDVSWQESRASAVSRIPPLLRIDSSAIDVADKAVEAVFADSISRNVRKGYLYPVDVTLWWTDTTRTETDSLHWIHAQINPPASFPSAVLGYFLRTSTVVPEERTERSGVVRRWTGVYGVPVPSDTSSLPAHEITIHLLRSHTDYARFATSRNTPEQREPVSNLSPGRGIVAGISMDSLTVEVDRSGNARR